MFTTIMYAVVNEVTRQPGSLESVLNAKRSDSAAPVMARARRRIRRAAATAPRAAPLPGTYRVLAESFKCAAGYR